MLGNIGIIDRTVRLVVALVLVGLIWAEIVTGGWALLLGIVAGVFLMTSSCGSCPIYTPFGINTCKRPEKKQQ